MMSRKFDPKFTPSPSVTLKLLFDLQLYTECQIIEKPLPPTCVMSFMNDPMAADHYGQPHN